MAVNPRLLDRSGDLKKALVDFGRGPLFRRDLDRWISERFPRGSTVEPGLFANRLDTFILEHRFDDGTGVIDRFLQEHPELPPEQAALVRGWKQVRECLFEVERHDGDTVVLRNLVDDLEYRVSSNIGPSALAALTVGTLVHARVAPIEDEWLLSGYTQTFKPAARKEIYRAAAEMARQAPQLVFRNPEKLAQAWEAQHRHRRQFIDFFGADLLVVPGRELPERMRAFMHYHTFEVRGEDGRTPAEGYQEEHGSLPSGPDHSFDEDLLARESVGIIFDEAEGLNFFPDFAQVEAAFADPELAREEPYRGAVLSYIESPGLSPLPLRRLAQFYPEGATRVVRSVYPDRPDFVWERDGEALMRPHKPDYQKPPLPSVTVLPPRLAEALADARSETEPAGGPRPGRNERCPCGSGRKYKHCCGGRR